ncbi:Maf family protein [Pseudaestuariivita rosea]|uniref:Maf family protein n=1 Tax=Pseudaestuariivita rosea TaxID=2763263 RepID=UPI001ABAF1EE|nr:Maf family protein [Pseudaestuariivita rosea]
MKLILGSGSPRRKELLAQLGLVPDEIRSPDVDEDPRSGELPRDYCARIARDKAAALDVADDEVIICADTTVALGRRILGKPEDASEAVCFLGLMSGRRHRVITAVAVKTPQRIWEKDVVTSVRMKRLSDPEINSYIASGDWQGKAGGYAIQGPAGAFIPWISGSYSAVMGLPVSETAQLLVAAGYPLYQSQ